MKVRQCAICGKDIFRENFDNRSKVSTCSKECYAELTRRKFSKEKVIKPCVICGKPVIKSQCYKDEPFTCGGECGRENVKRVNGAVCRERNKTLMTPEVKEKLRNCHLGKGDGKTYTKTYSRHTHRIVAEEKLGRPLKKGEIVHHKDENKRNNDPDNIHIFPSQAEHARFHMDLRYGRKTRDDL